MKVKKTDINVTAKKIADKILVYEDRINKLIEALNDETIYKRLEDLGYLDGVISHVVNVKDKSYFIDSTKKMIQERVNQLISEYNEFILKAKNNLNII